MTRYVSEKADIINSIELVSVFCVGTTGGDGGVAWVVDDTEGILSLPVVGGGEGRAEVCVGLGVGVGTGEEVGGR